MTGARGRACRQHPVLGKDCLTRENMRDADERMLAPHHLIVEPVQKLPWRE